MKRSEGSQGAGAAPAGPVVTDEQRARREAVIACHREGVSPCCRAAVDTSQLRPHGSRVHGPIFCSRCGSIVAWA